MKDSEEDGNPLSDLLKLRLEGEGEAHADHMRIARPALLAALTRGMARRPRDPRESIFNTLTPKPEGEQY